MRVIRLSAALVATLVYVGPVPPASAQSHDPDAKIAGGGTLPAGWHARTDKNKWLAGGRDSRLDRERRRREGRLERPGRERAEHRGARWESQLPGERQGRLLRRRLRARYQGNRGLSRKSQSRRTLEPARNS